MALRPPRRAAPSHCGRNWNAKWSACSAGGDGGGAGSPLLVEIITVRKLESVYDTESEYDLPLPDVLGVCDEHELNHH